jgi:RNA polymerase sigma factor (sigma-70 family)
MTLKEETENIVLIQNVLNGNHQAEEQFFKKYQKIVKDFIRNNFSSIKNIDDIDDCVQMILIQVFEHLKTYDPEKSNVKTWILIIAKHFMIDAYRKDLISFTSAFNNCGISINNGGAQNLNFNREVISNNIAQLDMMNSALSISNNASFGVSNNDFENCNAISYLSSQISPIDFNLLNMKYVQGYDYCEIGKEFNLTSSTVSNRINYIKTKLKKNNCGLNE